MLRYDFGEHFVSSPKARRRREKKSESQLWHSYYGPLVLVKGEASSFLRAFTTQYRDPLRRVVKLYKVRTHTSRYSTQVQYTQLQYTNYMRSGFSHFTICLLHYSICYGKLQESGKRNLFTTQHIQNSNHKNFQIVISTLHITQLMVLLQNLAQLPIKP